MRSKYAATLVIFLTLVVPNIFYAQESDDQQSPEHVAYIRLIEGEVGYQRGDDNQAQWSAAAANTPLMPGDSLYANDGGRAEVQLGDGNFLRAGKQGYIGVLQSNDQAFQFKVASGTATLRLRRLDRDYEIDTPNLAFSVEKPGEYRVDVDANGSTEITVHKGRGVASIGEDEEQELASPARLSLASDSADFAVSKEFTRDAWDRWNRRRDNLAYSARPQYVPPGVYGYETMSGHGRWMPTQEYGAVWVPTMGVGWQPYRLGRWAWVDPFGWTWVSYESWGWAPYHYGRWTHIEGVGWGWAPGPPTVRQRFSAALVAFVSGNQGGEWMGWFPLGPGEAYHPYGSREVSDARPVRQYTNYNYVTVVNRTEIYNSTTVVYNTRVVDRQVIENTQVATHCDMPPSRQTLYTPAVHVTGNRVVAVSNVSKPAPRPNEQIILRNVHVRTGEVPAVRKFDDKLAEMQKTGVVRPVNPSQPALSPVTTANRAPGNSANSARVAAEKPNPPGQNESHDRRPVGMPPGLVGKVVPAVNPSRTGQASGPAATTTAPPAPAPTASGDQPRPRYQPPADLERRVGRPANTFPRQEQARPGHEPPQEVDRRPSQPGISGLGREQSKPAMPPGQINERRTDEPQPAAPQREQSRPAYQPPQEVERHMSQPSAPGIQREEPKRGLRQPAEAQSNRPEPAATRRSEGLPTAPPLAVRMPPSAPTQSADATSPHQALRPTAEVSAGNGVHQEVYHNEHQPPQATASAQPREHSRQVAEAVGTRPSKSESKQKPAEDDGKDEDKHKEKN